MSDQILFNITGFVKKNLGRGKKLGYPTANIDVSLDTEEGLFVGYATHIGKKYPALIFIGPSITFNEIDKKGEVYILDFDENLYDKVLEVDVYKKLRNNHKFDSKEDLIKQMKKDEKDARAYFKAQETASKN